MNYDLKLEEYVLSCMVENKKCAEEVELLSEDDFVDSQHKEIYKAIKTLVKEQKKFDAMVLIQYISKKVDSKALEFLASTQAITTNFREYVNRLKDLKIKRELHLLAEKIMFSDLTGDETSEEAEREIFKIRENTSTAEFSEIQDLMAEALEEIESSQTVEGRVGLETGFTNLDLLTDGLQKQDYILIGARPSMGKTALALNITSQIALKGKKVAFFSLEMSKKQVAKRLILSESLVNDTLVKKRELNNHHYEKMTSIANTLSRSNIYINDTGSLTVAQMKSMCRKIKRTKGLDLVVIDYLQLIRSREGNGRREQVEAVSRDLKVMAKELNVPLIVISSLSRANESRQDKRPILSDLRETGQIEFDADLIMFLHRENYYNKEADPHHAELIIAKARNGELGIINLAWVGGCTKFLDWAKFTRKEERR